MGISLDKAQRSTILYSCSPTVYTSILCHLQRMPLQDPFWDPFLRAAISLKV
jgi:hypothetical protein